MARILFILLGLGIVGAAFVGAFGFEYLNHANGFAMMVGVLLTAGAAVEIAVLYNNRN